MELVVWRSNKEQESNTIKKSFKKRNSSFNSFIKGIWTFFFQLWNTIKKIKRTRFQQSWNKYTRFRKLIFAFNKKNLSQFQKLIYLDGYIYLLKI